MPSDLWPRVERLLARVERPSRYIDHEWGAHRRDGAAYRVALMYPDAYEIGMANQALQVLAERLLTIDDVAIER
ncbi:MAG: TIGR03960 family B12-binding radical SAM protein, partial [Coriobacteriia bacterium]